MHVHSAEISIKLALLAGNLTKKKKKYVYSVRLTKTESYTKPIRKIHSPFDVYLHLGVFIRHIYLHHCISVKYFDVFFI